MSFAYVADFEISDISHYKFGQVCFDLGLAKIIFEDSNNFTMKYNKKKL